MENKIIFWLASLPLLEFYLKLPLIEISTTLMAHRYEMREIEYVSYRVKIWKYQFHFSLYDTERKLRDS